MYVLNGFTYPSTKKITWKKVESLFVSIGFKNRQVVTVQNRATARSTQWTINSWDHKIKHLKRKVFLLAYAKIKMKQNWLLSGNIHSNSPDLRGRLQNLCQFPIKSRDNWQVLRKRNQALCKNDYKRNCF